MIAVTGASGHVGHCLCRELMKQGAHVRALVHRNEDDLADMGIELVRGDIRDGEAVIELCKGAKVVFHLAAKISIDNKQKELIYSTNVTGTQHVIDACRQQEGIKMIHFSTIHTFGTRNPEDVLDESCPPIMQSPIHYEHTKAEAERRVMKAASEGLNAVILNPTAIIGPFDYQPSYLGQALIRIYKNQLPMLVEGGYNFVDVRDVVEAALKAVTQGRPGERYIISGQWLSLGELSRKIGEISGKKTPKLVAPSVIARIGLPFIQAWATIARTHPLYTSESLEILKYSSRNISNAKARRELNLDPRPVEESLRDIFEWYRQNNMI